MEMKPGSRWKSAVDTTEVIVVRPPTANVVLECGGVPMTAPGEVQAGATLSPDHSAGTLIGKRYIDAESGIELLAAKAGPGSLSINGRPMTPKDAKPLPASD